MSINKTITAMVKDVNKAPMLYFVPVDFIVH